MISETQRLDLAFARSLDATLARRYAEAARLNLISDGLLEQLKTDGGRESDFARDVAALRDTAEPEEERRLDRTT